MLAEVQTVPEMSMLKGAFGSHHAVLTSPDVCPIPAFRPLVSLWFSQSRGGVPDYREFDVLDIPPQLWSHLLLLKTVGPSRRFRYEVIGDAIERHNGFPGGKRFLADLPLRHRGLMAREFVRTLHYRRPILSTSQYIGRANYVRRIYRIIAPYALADGNFAFVGLAFFTAISGMETKLENSTFAVPACLADLSLD